MTESVDINQFRLNRLICYAGGSLLSQQEKLVFSLNIYTSKYVKTPPNLKDLHFIIDIDPDIDTNIWALFFDLNLGNLRLSRCGIQAFSFRYAESSNKNQNLLSLHIPYNLFNPKIWILNRDETDLVQVDNPYYEEFRPKLEELVKIIKNAIGDREYWVISDSANCFKPEGVKDEEYKKLVEENSKKFI